MTTPSEGSHDKDSSIPSRESILENGYVRDDVARAVVRFIAAYRRTHRKGPTWREVGEHMGWSHGQATFAINRLRWERILYATREPRSLQLHARITPRKRPRLKPANRDEPERTPTAGPKDPAP
jgi:hypothetical protein